MHSWGRFVKHIASRVAIKNVSLFLIVRRKMAYLGVPKKSMWFEMAITFLIFMVGEWNKNYLKAEILKFFLQVSIYFSNNPPLSTIKFWMRQLNFPMTRCRIAAGIDSMISLTCSFICLIVAGLFSWFIFNITPKWNR